ncbi:type II toxin-antitoxin system ParD family antitoxin [Salinarimonas sp.]|uniref:type II toxin-antitoxin system ParD family antitoxin n=1 Tax=Salinarimonas sp. TaxID=2766526 RepID=UPI0032D95DFA
METVLPELDLGDHYERFITRQIAEGRFANASDVVRAALALLEQRERQRAEDDDWLADAIAESLDDPSPSVPGDEVFDRLERRYAADMAARRDGS